MSYYYLSCYWLSYKNNSFKKSKQNTTGIIWFPEAIQILNEALLPTKASFSFPSFWRRLSVLIKNLFTQSPAKITRPTLCGLIFNFQISFQCKEAIYRKTSVLFFRRKMTFSEVPCCECMISFISWQNRKLYACIALLQWKTNLVNLEYISIYYVSERNQKWKLVNSALPSPLRDIKRQ